MNSIRHYSVIRLILLVVLTAAQPGNAQPVDATTRTAARELATQGAEAFERGDFALAYDRLTRAFALYPVPSISIMQSRALVHLGRFVEALDRYEETQRMPLADDAPEAYLTAKREAGSEAEQLRPRIPRVFIRVKTAAANPSDVSVTLDRRVLPAALLEVDCPTDPGSHVLVLRVRGQAVGTTTFQISEKERKVVELTATTQSTIAPLNAKSEGATGFEATNGASKKWWGYGAIGGGAVALVGSVITGKSALDKKSHLDKICDPGCPSGSQGDIDSFRLNRTLSYASAGLSLALVGVGGYLLLTGERTGQSTAIEVRPNGITWVGRF